MSACSTKDGEREMPLCSKACVFFLLKKSNSGRVCRSVNVLAFVAKAADYWLSANDSGMGNVPQTSPELSRNLSCQSVSYTVS